MNRDDIIGMAQEAGLHLATDVNWMPIIGLEYAEKFATLIADAEARRIHDEGMVTIGHMREQIEAERSRIADHLDEVMCGNYSALREQVRSGVLWP